MEKVHALGVEFILENHQYYSLINTLTFALCTGLFDLQIRGE